MKPGDGAPNEPSDADGRVPTSGSRCPVCQLGTVASGVCTRCGTAFGEGQRCPHCKVVARAEPKLENGVTFWVCSACGGPRIPDGLGGAVARASLVETKAFRSKAIRDQAARLLFFVMATFTTLVLVAAWPHALAAKLVLGLFAVLPAILALQAHARASRARHAADEAMENAWLRAAEEVARTSPTGITAEELADRLHIDPRRADALLTKLAVHDRTRIEVGDDAEVRYSVSPETMTNVRLDLDSDVSDEDASEELRGASVASASQKEPR